MKSVFFGEKKLLFDKSAARGEKIFYDWRSKLKDSICMFTQRFEIDYFCYKNSPVLIFNKELSLLIE